MQYTAPDYFKKFSCTADHCPDTCCAGWQIQIDPLSLKKYRKAKGMLKNRLKNEIDWNQKCFRRYNGRCAFLNDDNLCDLYLEGGGTKAFCRTCRTYPRHIEEYEGLREISLSLSCPAAADIILGNTGKVQFLHAEDPNKKEPRPDDYDDFDYFLFTKLTDARELILRIIQDRSHPLKLRASIVLALSHDLQERIDHGALYDADRLFDRYKNKNTWSWFKKRLEFLSSSKDYKKKRQIVIRKLFSIWDHLENMQDSWKGELHEALRVLNIHDRENEIPEPETGFSCLFTDVTAEQLLVYFIYTYFCGAVYNYNAYGKIKFAFAGMFLIRELFHAKYLHTRSLNSYSDLVSVAYKYSREVEHSDFNKIRMEEFLSDENDFTLEDLMILF